jgi:hypothetical protein
MTDKGVAALKRRAQRYTVPDPELRGHWIRIQPSGTKSFWAVTRNPHGRQIWTHIGPADVMAIDDARVIARGILSRVRAGLPAMERKAETFAAVVENWRKRHVEGQCPALGARDQPAARRPRPAALEGLRVHHNPALRRRCPAR